MSDAPKPPEFRAPVPGPEHQVLARDAGEWDAEILVRPGPGMPPIASRGQAVNRLVCSGLWLTLEFQNETGFQGRGLIGYDPARGKYVGTWVDNTRTFLAVSEGTWDASTRTLTMWAEAPGAGGKPTRWKETTASEGPDRRVWRSFVQLANGVEHEALTVSYSRRATIPPTRL